MQLNTTHFFLFHKFFPSSLVFVTRNTNKTNIPTFQFLLQFFQFGNFSITRSTPRGPNIHINVFSFQIGKTYLIPVYILEFKRNSRSSFPQTFKISIHPFVLLQVIRTSHALPKNTIHLLRVFHSLETDILHHGIHHHIFQRALVLEIFHCNLQGVQQHGIRSC